MGAAHSSEQESGGFPESQKDTSTFGVSCCGDRKQRDGVTIDEHTEFGGPWNRVDRGPTSFSRAASDQTWHLPVAEHSSISRIGSDASPRRGVVPQQQQDRKTMNNLPPSKSLKDLFQIYSDNYSGQKAAERKAEIAQKRMEMINQEFVQTEKLKRSMSSDDKSPRNPFERQGSHGVKRKPSSDVTKVSKNQEKSLTRR